MPKSILCLRIGLCESMEKMNKTGLDQVTRLLYNILNISTDTTVTTTNETTTTIKTIFVQTKTLSDKQLEKFQISMDKLLSDPKYIEKQATQASQQSTTTDDQTLSSQKETNNSLFALLRLPHDLLMKTAVFLDEEDILRIETCCRLFYTMVNDTSYLNQCNSFPRLIFTSERLKQISDSSCNYSFFKYCKADKLVMRMYTNVAKHHAQSAIDQFVTSTRELWDKAKKNWIKQGWFETLFKSIKVLELNADAMVLLDKIPLELLFDPYISHLESIDELNYYWNVAKGINHLYNSNEKFAQQYLELKKKLGVSSLKRLKLVKHLNGSDESTIGRLTVLDTTHLWLNRMIIDLEKEINVHVRSITSQFNIGFKFGNKNDIADNSNCNVETVKLLEFSKESNCDICDNKTVIDACNFDKTLKNLMIDIGTNASISDKWKNAIECVITKQYCRKLENVILLLERSDDEWEDQMNWIFQLLRKYQGLLKYQFKMLLIGFTKAVDVNRAICHAFEINSSVDDIDKFLNENETISKQKFVYQDKQKNRDMYDNLIARWSD